MKRSHLTMKPPKPAEGQTWVRRRDNFIVGITHVTRTKITVCTRAELLVYDYTPEAFQRYFRLPRVPIAPTTLYET